LGKKEPKEVRPLSGELASPSRIKSYGAGLRFVAQQEWFGALCKFRISAEVAAEQVHDIFFGVNFQTQVVPTRPAI
jgi:hypothetical protein